VDPTLAFLLHTVLREWVWDLFINGFCVHLVRPLVLALVFAITFFGVGRSYGLPALFLRPSTFERFAIGAGVGVLVWQTILAGYLFEEFATNYTIDRPPFCEVRPVPEWVWPWSDREVKYELDTGAKWYDDMRYRFVPASIWSVLRYALAVAAGAGAVLVLVAVAAIVRWTFRTMSRSGTSAGWGMPSKYFRIRAVYVFGIIAGFGTAAAIASLFLPGQFVHDKSFTTATDKRPVELNSLHTFAYQTGEALIRLGGWGNAAARDAAFDLQSSDEENVPLPVPDQVTTRKNFRYKFEPYYPVYGVFCLGFVALVLWNVFLLLWPGAFSPAAGLLLLLHLLLFGQTFASYFFAAPTLFLLTLAGLMVLCAGRYKMRFPGLSKFYRRPLLLQKHYDAIQAEPIPPHEAPTVPEKWTSLHSNQLTRWNNGVKKPLAVVCVSGGGSRAAAWTMKVLTTLEKELPTFPYHIRLITGASGGMFGATYYTASLPPLGTKRLPDITIDPLPKPGSNRYPSVVQLNTTVRGDFLSPVVRALVKNDLIRPFQPFAYGGDRGAALEGAWSELLGGWLDLSFADLWAGELEGWRPSLAFSPMLVEDGRQLVISNLSLRRAMVNLGQVPGMAADQVLSREGVEFFKLFESSGHDPRAVRQSFRIATAARMSASFPYMFPGVSLPTEPRRRVVDAGYYDNYGVCLAAGWLLNHIDWLKANVSQVAIVHIRDGVSTGERLMMTPAPDTTSAFGLAAESLTTPPTGLNSSRVAASTFRNDNLLHLLSLFFREHKLPFVTTAFEFPGGEEVSLNFCLPPGEAELIDRGIENAEVQSAIRCFVNWWPTGS
jgi:predicted acylesterase/phospholipase RssA